MSWRRFIVHLWWILSRILFVFRFVLKYLRIVLDRSFWRRWWKRLIKLWKDKIGDGGFIGGKLGGWRWDNLRSVEIVLRLAVVRWKKII
jgi:hypothetical protein